MDSTALARANEETKSAWNANASFWNEKMGEGNRFVKVLLWPATERLLEVKEGQTVLDVACGNGLTSRKVADLGAHVVALDFAEEMIGIAKERSIDYGDRISYHVVDATKTSDLLDLGRGKFDSALCNMALFDMAEIQPLLNALTDLLKPGGHFVFSMMHPCFNNPHMSQGGELQYLGDQCITVYSVKVFGYMSETIEPGLAINGQPKPHLYFHRPIQSILSACFKAGFVLDGLEERSFPPDEPSGSHPISWGGNFSEIPPVMVFRICKPVS